MSCLSIAAAALLVNKVVQALGDRAQRDCDWMPWPRRFAPSISFAGWAGFRW
jgi:hypothetical protein